jgi:engulfment and cell motility protein 1
MNEVHTVMQFADTDTVRTAQHARPSGLGLPSLYDMSSHANGDSLRQRVAANGASPRTLIPTNSVTTKDGVVKVRIDPTLTVADVVKQLVANLQIRQPPSDFALRDEDDELVTNENLRKMIRSKAKLKYVVNLPESDLSVTPLPSGSSIPQPLRLRRFMTKFSFAMKRVSGWPSFPYNATFAYAIIIHSLQCTILKDIQEEDFANEFLKRDGVRVLVDVITSSYGNTLAVRTFFPAIA